MNRRRNGFSSRLPGFYKLKLEERLRRLGRIVALSREEQMRLLEESLPPETADQLIENVVGVFGMPLGLAANFRINGRDYLVPMAVEETSIVAAASGAARLVRDAGRLEARATEPLMIAQIQIVAVPDVTAASRRVLEAKASLLELAADQDATLVSLGGGPRDLECRQVSTEAGTMMVIHLLVDVRDAMGANAVNSMAEALGPELADLTGGEVVCRILTNLSDRRTVRARMEVDREPLAKNGLPGSVVAERIVQASAWAEADPYRAATSNKGILNAVDAVLLATGNDWRAVEAGAHAYAARSGQYRSLSRFTIQNDRLVGELELPLAVGTVGGVTRVHPAVRVLLRILNVESAGELAEVIGAVGLVQNFAALRSLVSEGIQRGHMRLHARNLAQATGAPRRLVGGIAERMVREGAVRFDRAREILRGMLEKKVYESI